MGKPTGKTYEIETIADIFDKLDADQIARFCDDFKKMAVHVKAVQGFSDAVLSDAGMTNPQSKLQRMEWIDDGRHDVDCHVELGDTPLFTTKIRSKGENNESR